MTRTGDRYGRGSASVNGAGFVDLEPGDTFAGLEKKLRANVSSCYRNDSLGIVASIGSMRNANELAQHMSKGEPEEVHKFAAKNIGLLFEGACVGIRHLDKKAVPGQRWVTVYLRLFSLFYFAGRKWIATITLKEAQGGCGIYSVEALEISWDAQAERKPRGAMPCGLNSAPLQPMASFTADKIAYYVGDVNRTNPTFLGPLADMPFSACALIEAVRQTYAKELT